MKVSRIGKVKEGKIKPKVLFGYIFVLSIALAALAISYQAFVELLETRHSLSEPSRKLIKINSILTDIYEAESNIRTYTLTQNEGYLSIYVSFMSDINKKVDSLLALSQYDPVQSEKIKFIQQLLTRKRRVLNELVELKRTDQSSRFYQLALEEVEKLEADSIRESAVISSVTTTTTSRRDSIIKKAQEEEPQGLISRFFGMFTKKEPVDTTITKLVVDVETKIDTLRQAVMSSSDSLLNEVVKILTLIQEQQEMALYNIGEKELELLKSDKEIMDQIRTVVSLLEREELMNSYRIAEETEEAVRKSTLLLLILGGTALFITIVFTAVIFRDISRANYYRNQLLEAKLLAEKLLKVKEEFLANISHEIRTPLSAIIGFSRQLKRADINSKHKLFVDSMYSSSQHLLQIVNDVLDLSKIEEGYLSFESIPFSPKEIAQETIDTFTLKAQEKGLSTSLDAHKATQHLVVGDPFRLRQILYNLVSNAVKFTDKGSINLKIKELKTSTEKTTYRFIVQDTGIGIPLDKINSIFNQFTQVDSSVSRMYGGTGLGLTIVKKLTELQGGKVMVQSKVNEGTAFAVDLSYSHVTEPTLSKEEATPIEKLQLPSSLKVLAIDDDPTGQLLITEILKSLGIRPTVIGNSQQALNQLKQKKYDVVISDIQMPGLSGFDLIKEVKGAGKPEPPVFIALTANNISNSPSIYSDAGFQSVLIKPTDEVEIYNVLAPILGYKTIDNTKEDTTNSNEYDITDVCRFAENDKDSIKTILQSFIDNSTQNISALEKNINQNNWKGVGEVSHRMKSAFRQLKVNRVVNSIEMLENNHGANLTQQEIEGALQTIQSEVERVNNLLRADIVKCDTKTV